MPTLTRPNDDEYLSYYGKYISLVPDGDVVAMLAQQLDDTESLLASIGEEGSMHRYAEGKWSVKEVVSHVSDTERIFAYRALRFARADATPLPGYDENAYAPMAGADARPLDALVAELRAVRRATVATLQGFPPEAAQRRGSANGAQMSVRALAWTIAGHELHHRNVLRERYLK
ncbi:MAG: DinB-like domain protein [Gemmatimonadetes bacterium]|nr:DinB-like domain protein [Gemmatimonadota bacterium]